MRLTETAVRSFAVAKLFRDHKDKINSMDFSTDGSTLISSSDDDSIVLYNCLEGVKGKQTFSKKYGVDLIRLTHAANTAVHASTKVDDTIRYLSLHDNKYIRYFPGHTKKVTCLCMSPADDLFISGSLDRTLRLWDLRSNNCQGLMNLPSRPVAAFDPEGLIFGVGMEANLIKLYDLRTFDKGPFSTFKLDCEIDCDWTGLKFSPDGRYILITTNGSVIRLIDAYDGHVKHSLKGHVNEVGDPLEASFSPDNHYIFSGTSNGCVTCWQVETGASTVLQNNKSHVGPVQCCQFNPKYMMMVTACQHIAFWLPEQDE